MTLQQLLEQLSAGGTAWTPALLDVAAKGIVVMALTALAAVTMRRSSAATRHLVWLLGTCSLLLLPLLCAALPGWHILPPLVGNSVSELSRSASSPQTSTDPVPTSPSSVGNSPGASRSLPELPRLPQPALPSQTSTNPAGTLPPGMAAPPQARIPSLPPLSWQSCLLLTWATGALLLFAHIALGFLSLRWLEHRSTRLLDDDWTTALGQIRHQLGIRRQIILLTSERRTMPMTWGLFRTRLLLPADSLAAPPSSPASSLGARPSPAAPSSAWSPDQRRSVVLHELAHAKRHDCLTQLLVQLTCALYWFNPLIWFAWHRIQTERERACDDLVLATGTKPSTYAQQLLHIASEMPPARLSAAAIAMARPGKLEGRLLAILDTTRNRKRLAITTVIAAVIAVGLCSAFLAILRAEDVITDPALQAVTQWAQQHGWKAQAVATTTLESQWGCAWRNLPFELSKEEEADAQACVRLQQTAHDYVNGVQTFSTPATRTALEAILAKRPGYFYAEFLLASWHRDYGEAKEAERLLAAAYEHAPVIAVQRYQLADGTPLANTPIQSFALECNGVKNGYLDPSLQLEYDNLRTDAQGCIYLPVYNTVYRTNSMANPSGYAVDFPRLGWFETSRKVAMLPAAAATPKPGDFPAADIGGPVKPTAVLPDGQTVELLAISPYPDPKDEWWLPDGSSSPRKYQTGEPGMKPWPAESGRCFIFHFAKALPDDAHMQFRYSVPCDAQTFYTNVRAQDLAKPFTLFAAFPTHPKSITLRMGIAAGQWKTLVSYDSQSGKTTGDLPAGFVFKDAKDNGNSAEITVVHPRTDLQYRLFATDENNREHQADNAGLGQSGDIVQDYYRFRGVPLASIKSFRLESREYQWVQFTNIAAAPASEKPATTQATAFATLPNGVTIELVGIAPSVASSDPAAAPAANAWFSPTGAPVAAPYTSLETNLRYQPGAAKSIADNLKEIRSRPNPREFAFVLRGLKDRPTQPRYAFYLPGSTDELYRSEYNAAYRYDNDGTDWWTYTSLINHFYGETPGDRVTIRVALASGPSTVSGTAPVDRASALTVEGSPILLAQPIEANGHARFNLEYDPAVHTVRVVAVSRSGREYPNAGNAGATEGPANDAEHPGFARDILDLSEPSLQDIDHLVIRTRPMCWAEFRNVPLKAGLANTLEVAAGSTVRPAASTTSAATTQPDAWGPAVEGVSLCLRTTKGAGRADEAPPFVWDIRNQGTRQFLQVPAGDRLAQLEVDGAWYVRPPDQRIAQLHDLGVGASLINQEIDLSATWQKAASEELEWHPEGFAVSPADKPEPLQLSPGRHTFRVATIVQPSRANTGNAIRVISAPLEIVIPEMRFKDVQSPPATMPATNTQSTTSVSIMPAAAAEHSGAFPDRAAAQLVGDLKAQRLPFLSDAALESLGNNLRNSLASAPKPDPAKAEAILKSLHRCVPIYFPANDAEEVYLGYSDRIATLQWKLWLALTRQPLSPDEDRRRAAQVQWLHDFINAIPEPAIALRAALKKPGQLHADAIADLDACLSDPLALTAEPFSDARFQELQQQLQPAGKWAKRWASQSVHQPADVLFPVEIMAMDALVVTRADPAAPYGVQYTVARFPFADQVIGAELNGRAWNLYLRSNSLFRGWRTMLYHNNGDYSSSVADVASYRYLNYPADPAAREKWYAEKRFGDVIIAPSGDALLAVRGARTAPLTVTDWFAADRMKDADLAAVLDKQGADSASIADIPDRMKWMQDNGLKPIPPHFYVLRTAENRLSVIRVLQRDVSAAPSCDIYVRTRPAATPSPATTRP